MAGRSNLSARLKLLRQHAENSQRGDIDLPVPGGIFKAAGGDEKKPLGGEWEQIGPYIYRCVTIYPDPFPTVVWPSLFLPDVDSLDHLVFIDTETTGLSGGAGTVAFLIGFGKRTEPGEFEVTQLFLADYPGENDYLKHLETHIDAEACLVSYNGASFDLPLLATRFRMNGLEFPPFRHMDLLYPTRRFWKTLLDSCSLGTIERRILGVVREMDVPGAEVPERYFSYLSSGDSRVLDEVFAHHGQDILSLAKLFAKLEEILRAPQGVYGDGYGIGRTMFELGVSGWIGILQRAFDAGNQSAGRYLAIQAKRLGDWKRCVPIWRGMIGNEYGSWAAVEWAKFLEHRQKDPLSALAIMKSLKVDAQTSASFQINLKRRIERLSKKAGNLNAQTSDS